MNDLFADTSFYVALCFPKDVNHAKAVELARTHDGQLITTEYVLVETGNWFCRTHQRASFVELMGELESDPMTTILEGTHDWFRAGQQRYFERLDKDWSMTDCLSFVVTEKLGLTTALTADHHFEQAGFKILL